MRRFVLFSALAAALASLAFPNVAFALGVVSVGQTEQPIIDEEFFFVTYDETNQQEHIVFALRLAPAQPRITLALPVPSEPTFSVVDDFDPGRALFSLVAPEEQKTRGRPPAQPAPWPIRGVTLKGTTSLAMASDVLFDVAWLHAYANAGFPKIAEVLVETPSDGRLETTTPGAHLSFKTDRVVLPRREPKRASKEIAQEAPGQDQARPKNPFEVQSVRTEPKDAGPSEEVVLRVLRARSGPLLDCYEVLLEQSPTQAPTLRLEATIRPKGETAQLKLTGGPDDTAQGKAFASCLVAELRKKQFPRTDEGWKLSAELRFTPPHARPRRSQIVVLSPSRLVWRSAPRAARKEHDFLVSAEDLKRALGQPLLRSLGLSETEPAWLTHYLDRDERRALAEDAVFEREAKPPEPEADAKRAPSEAQAKPIQSTEESLRARPKRLVRKAITMAASALLTVMLIALALWLSREENTKAR